MCGCVFLNDKGSPSAAVPPHLSWVCICARLSAHSSVGGIEIIRGWVEKRRKRRGRAERQGEGDDREGGGGGMIERARGKGNLATATFCSGLDIWKLCFASKHTQTHAHSTADDNVCWGKVSHAVLRIICPFLHGAANFERGFWNGRWSSELTSCVCTCMCVRVEIYVCVCVCSPYIWSHWWLPCFCHI